MKREPLLIPICLVVSSAQVIGETTEEGKSEKLKDWKFSIVEEIRERTSHVTSTFFRRFTNSCVVSFKLNHEEGTRMKYLSASLVLSFALLLQASPSLAESDGEPEWTKKIPQNRYPCICDPLPPSLQPLKQPEATFRDNIEKALKKALKVQLSGFQFKDPSKVRFEIGYAVTKDNQFLYFLERRSSDSAFFNASVYRAISLTCNPPVSGSKDPNANGIELHFLFTPDATENPQSTVVETKETRPFPLFVDTSGKGAKCTEFKTNNPVTEDLSNRVVDKKIWDEWHKKLAEELFVRIGKQVAICLGKHSQLHCIVTWRVWRNREIDLLEIEGTDNILFREIIALEVKSMVRSPLAVFPKGSEDRAYADKRSEYSFGIFQSRIGDFDSSINRKIPFLDGKKEPSK